MSLVVAILICVLIYAGIAYLLIKVHAGPILMFVIGALVILIEALMLYELVRSGTI